METLKEAMYIAYSIFMSFPKELNQILLAMIVIAFIVTIFISIKTNKKPKNKVKRNRKEPEIGDLGSFFFTFSNVKIDQNQKIDKIFGYKSGIYLVFNYPKIKGVLTGDLEDEFIFMNKKKILNPINEKHSYIAKISKKFNIEEENIKIVIKTENVKSIELKNNNNKCIKTDENFDFGQGHSLTEEQLYSMSDILEKSNR